MNYIVFDLEWNQAASEGEMITSPVFLTGEIIEIGAVKLNDTFQTVDELKLLIRPQYYTKLHRAVAALTRIHDKDLESALPFPEAFRQFREWCGEEYTYLTWSGSDLPMLIDNMLLHGIDVTDLPDTCDIQRIFSREIMRIDRKLRLDDALAVLGEQGDKAHDALHDARNTVIVCNHLELDSYIGEYTSRVFAEQAMDIVFESPAQALQDERLRTADCPWCGQELTFEDWIFQGHDEHITFASCPDGDEFLVVLTITRHRPGQFRASRLFYEMSDDFWDYYCDKKEARE